MFSECRDIMFRNRSRELSWPLGSERIKMEYMIDKDYPGAETGQEHCIPKVPHHTASDRLC